MQRLCASIKIAKSNIQANWLISFAVVISAALISGALFAILFISKGAEDTLRLSKARLGADLMLVAEGNQERLEHALLMGVPTEIWMPREVLDEVRKVEGVAVASPQLFLSTMRGASCCSVSDMFMVAYEPESDFTVTPWLQENLNRSLQLGEAVGGRYISIPEGRTDILIYGYGIDLVGNIATTGSGLDHTMFFTFDTAIEISRLSPMRAEKELSLNPNSISAILVKAAPKFKLDQLSQTIRSRVPGVTVITREELFDRAVESVESVQRAMGTILVVIWVLSVGIIGLLSSLTLVNRTRGLGMLRCVGASKRFVLTNLILEGLILSVPAVLFGVGLAYLVLRLFAYVIASGLGIPLLPLTLLQILGVTGLILMAVLFSLVLSAILPSLFLLAKEPDTLLKDG